MGNLEEVKISFLGRLVAAGPLERFGQQTQAGVGQELSVSQDRLACTCELCRTLHIESQTIRA